MKSSKNIITPTGDSLSTQIAVIGSGPGGAITATRLAESGLDVTMIEEGPHLSLDSSPHFSLDEITQKYRGGGITVGMGKTKVAYAEGRCVGGGSEINRGLYHRVPSEVLDFWSREFRVEALNESELAAHFDACEQGAKVSHLPSLPSLVSLKLHEGASTLGWSSIEVPRLTRYDLDDNGKDRSTKESMSQTFVPKYLAGGGKLLPNTRVQHIKRNGSHWHIHSGNSGNGHRSLEIIADTVFVACGAIQTSALLRRSGFKRNVGNSLRFHPMIKVAAQFAEKVNLPGELDPVHQIKEFDPRFSMGCSATSQPALALALASHPEYLGEVDRHHQYMGLYYAQTTGGQGIVRNLPGFNDPFVRVSLNSSDLRELAEALRRLCECLFAAGAIALYPDIAGFPKLKSIAGLDELPDLLPADRASLSTLHLFSTCPMGEDRTRCAVDSFGKMFNTDQLYIADASLLCGPTVVNPQGSVMAVAHRNVMEYLDRLKR